jgi:hypothetical protein
MKKLLWFLLATLFFMTGCRNHYHEHSRGNNVSIHVRETDDLYQIDARFARTKTQDILEFLGEKLHTDALADSRYHQMKLQMEHGAELYVQSKPGKISIRVNRVGHDELALQEVKNLAEELKTAILR